MNEQSNVSGVLNGAPTNSIEPLNFIVQHFAISHGVNLLLANAVFRQPQWNGLTQSSPRALLTLSVGGGTSLPHAESVIEGHADEHYQVGSPAIQFAGSLELRVWQRLYWSGEYKFTRTHEQVAVFDGRVTVLLQSHHVVTGPVIHF